MRLTYKTSKIGFFAAVMGLLSLVACKDDFPQATDSSGKETVLNSIKIVNAGANGNIVMEGVVDEDAKTVSFARIDTLTNFANLKFEATTSNGAKLDKEVYPVTFGEGESEKVIVVKVQNSPRFREYLVRLRLKVAVFGADFEKPTTYDFTSNPLGRPIYDAFNGALTRGTGFDGKQVLIVRRETTSTQTPHLLNVDELKNGVVNKILLNTTGITGGTYAVNMGALINGHTYIANLSGGQVSPLKVYHWTNPSVAPQLIANLNVASIADAGIRHGDNFSVSLDDQGNGYFFFVDNAGGKVLRVQVANYTTVNNPVVFVTPITVATVGTGAWSTYNRIGNTSDYLFTGHEAPIALASDGGVSSFTMSKTAIYLRSSDARIVYFNGERYLIVTTAARGPGDFTNFRVYDITKGANVKDALTNLNNLPEDKPIFNYSLMGPINGSPASQTGFYVKKDAQGKDETLTLYSAASDAGFVFFEFGKKTSE